MTQIDPAERHVLDSAAALLDLGQTVDRLSRALTVLAFAGLLAGSGVHLPQAARIAMVIAAVAGLGCAYAGARVAFDAALFRQVSAETGGFAGLDCALLQLGLLPQEKAGRPVAARLAGATRLMRWQGLALVLQAAALIAAGFAGV